MTSTKTSKNLQVAYYVVHSRFEVTYVETKLIIQSIAILYAHDIWSK